jgi:uncharacterized protein (UPF0333 family)
MAAPANERRIGDALLSVTAALPNAANTVNSNSVDLSQVTPFPTTEQMWIKISSTIATGANNKNINIRLTDSADDTTFANVANVANPLFVAVANATKFIPNTGVTFAMPKNIKRYVRLSALGEENGGDAGDGTYTFSVLF